MRFDGKIVLVTGASSGIGAAIAHEFASEGASVTLVGRNKDKLDIVAEKCGKYGTIPLIINADVAKDDDVKRIINETISKWGKLDVLINNAGIIHFKGILDDDAMEYYDNIMAVNLRSVVLLTHLSAKHLIATKGNVVNISSILSTKPSSSFAYNCSKAGMDHFTRCVALELATHGVRVNCVNPGPVYTDLVENIGMPPQYQEMIWDKMKNATLLDRISQPDEVASIVKFLVGAEGVTGSCYVVDNGTLLK